MPRSRSRSIESSTCARMYRGSTVCVISRMRSASVDFPWSMWAMIEKLRMWSCAAMRPSRIGGGSARAPAQPPHDDLLEPLGLGNALHQHRGRVDGEPRERRDADGHDLRRDRAAE